MSVSHACDPTAYEQDHVHSVYSQIASHFSSTRYKPWPLIEAFLRARPGGSIGLDIGCGNGKYLSCNPSIFIVGSDRSHELVDIAAREHRHGRHLVPKPEKERGKAIAKCKGSQEIGRCGISDVLTADTLSLPHPSGRFDFAICIAVVHHLSTRERRREAVRAVLACLKHRRGSGRSEAVGTSCNGQAMIYVWALEQKGSRRGWEEGGKQDVMVPWVLKTGKKKGNAVKHEASPVEANAAVTDSAEGPEEEEISAKVFHRYYHLYQAGELEEDVRAVGGHVVDSGYERDNWWGICERSDGHGDACSPHGTERT